MSLKAVFANATNCGMLATSALTVAIIVGVEASIREFGLSSRTPSGEHGCQLTQHGITSLFDGYSQRPVRRARQR